MWNSTSEHLFCLLQDHLHKHLADVTKNKYFFILSCLCPQLLRISYCYCPRLFFRLVLSSLCTLSSSYFYSFIASIFFSSCAFHFFFFQSYPPPFLRVDFLSFAQVQMKIKSPDVSSILLLDATARTDARRE